MRIQVNGAEWHCEEGLSLEALLEQMQLAPDSVSTVLNETFIARHQRAQYRLKAGDVVLTFAPITGG